MSRNSLISHIDEDAADSIKSERCVLEEKRLSKQLDHLSQELDYLGIELDVSQFEASSKESVAALCKACHELIQLYRSALREADLAVDKNCKTKSDLQSLAKTLEGVKRTVAKKEQQELNFNRSLVLKDLELDKLKGENNALKTDLTLLKKHYNSKEKQLQHNLKKILHENDTLEDVCRMKTGKYQSKDDMMVKMSSEFRRKEDIYKRTMCQLEKNNQDLLEELLNLKERLVLN